MTTARTIGGPAYPKMIKEMERVLNNIIEDFDRAVYAESLRLAHERSKLSFLNSWMVGTHELGIERLEREQVERVRLKRERAEQQRTDQEPADQERTEQVPADQPRAHERRPFEALLSILARTPERGSDGSSAVSICQSVMVPPPSVAHPARS